MEATIVYDGLDKGYIGEAGDGALGWGSYDSKPYAQNPYWVARTCGSTAASLQRRFRDSGAGPAPKPEEWTLKFVNLFHVSTGA